MKARFKSQGKIYRWMKKAKERQKYSYGCQAQLLNNQTVCGHEL